MLVRKRNSNVYNQIFGEKKRLKTGWYSSKRLKSTAWEWCTVENTQMHELCTHSHRALTEWAISPAATNISQITWTLIKLTSLLWTITKTWSTKSYMQISLLVVKRQTFIHPSLSKVSIRWVPKCWVKYEPLLTYQPFLCKVEKPFENASGAVALLTIFTAIPAHACQLQLNFCSINDEMMYVCTYLITINCI